MRPATRLALVPAAALLLAGCAVQTGDTAPTSPAVTVEVPQADVTLPLPAEIAPDAPAGVYHLGTDEQEVIYTLDAGATGDVRMLRQGAVETKWRDLAHGDRTGGSAPGPLVIEIVTPGDFTLNATEADAR